MKYDGVSTHGINEYVVEGKEVACNHVAVYETTAGPIRVRFMLGCKDGDKPLALLQDMADVYMTREMAVVFREMLDRTLRGEGDTVPPKCDCTKPQ